MNELSLTLNDYLPVNDTVDCIATSDVIIIQIRKFDESNYVMLQKPMARQLGEWLVKQTEQ